MYTNGFWYLDLLKSNVFGGAQSMKLEEFKPVNQYKAINWNEVSDMIDKATWEKLTEQFWLDTRIPVANDIDNWRE